LTLQDLHDTILDCGDDDTIQRWGDTLAAAAAVERGDRPATWALVLRPLLAAIPRVVDPVDGVVSGSDSPELRIIAG
jgi:hypothetical protein